MELSISKVAAIKEVPCFIHAAIKPLILNYRFVPFNMRKLVSITLGLFVTSLVVAQKNKTFYDSLGNETTFESHWSQVVGGRYKSVHDKKTNSKTLERTSDKEFNEELSKTERRITKKHRLGTDFPDFMLTDLDGDTINKEKLRGKVAVINFWFVGCSPCEMERPELNGLANLYEDNENVIFISFARNDSIQLRRYLIEHPFAFKPIPTKKGEIEAIFGFNSYPVTIIIDKDGKYAFHGSGTGLGISYILKREIELALKN